MGRPIYLIGPRACGKTTIARMLVERLDGYTAVDTDELFCERSGQSIADFVAANGWTRFREEEQKTLQACAELARSKNLIVATGGGIVLDPRNCQLMRSSGWVCYLKVPERVLIERLCADPKAEQRPALGPGSVQEEVHSVLAKRAELYESCASYVLAADRPLQELCRELAEQFRESAK
ncbi:MAG: shikimate kinase AroL [Desulfovibrio sp.]|nr:shikimate kinase AroL [Desulfovibrio sp.]